MCIVRSEGGDCVEVYLKNVDEDTQGKNLIEFFGKQMRSTEE